MWAAIAILVLLWFAGYIRIPWLRIPNFSLFNLNRHPIRLWDILIFIVILWAIEMLPSPLRQIVVVLVLLWVLSSVGILAIAGLSKLIVVAIIVGLVLSVFSSKN